MIQSLHRADSWIEINNYILNKYTLNIALSVSSSSHTMNPYKYEKLKQSMAITVCIKSSLPYFFQ
jgi:hypothetical protein